MLAILLSLAACERPAERRGDREYAARLLTGLLAYPKSTLVTVNAGQGAAEVTCRVALCPAGGNRIPKHLPTVLHSPVGRLQRAAAFDPA